MKDYRSVVLTYTKRTRNLPDVFKYVCVRWQAYGRVAVAIVHISMAETMHLELYKYFFKERMGLVNIIWMLKRPKRKRLDSHGIELGPHICAAARLYPVS